jgi:integrase
LRALADCYLKEVKATRKAKTSAAYRVALDYFIEAVGDKPVKEITRHDMLDFRVVLREDKKQSARSEWNKFTNVMGFLKAQAHKPGVTNYDWPQYVEEEPEIYEDDFLEKFFRACTRDERLIYEFLLQTGWREQEVVYATDRCLDFDHNEVTVKHNPEYGWTPKCYKERTVAVSAKLMQGLKEMLVRGAREGCCFRPRTANRNTTCWRCKSHRRAGGAEPGRNVAA